MANNETLARMKRFLFKNAYAAILIYFNILLGQFSKWVPLCHYFTE